MDSEHTSYTSSQPATTSCNSSCTSKCPEALAVAFVPPSNGIASGTSSSSKSDLSNAKPKRNSLLQSTTEYTLTTLPLTEKAAARNNLCECTVIGGVDGCRPNEENSLARNRILTGTGEPSAAVSKSRFTLRPRGSLPYAIESRAASSSCFRAKQLNLTQPPPPFTDDHRLPVVEQRRRLGVKSLLDHSEIGRDKDSSFSEISECSVEGCLCNTVSPLITSTSTTLIPSVIPDAGSETIHGSLSRIKALPDLQSLLSPIPADSPTPSLGSAGAKNERLVDQILQPARAQSSICCQSEFATSHRQNHVKHKPKDRVSLVSTPSDGTLLRPGDSPQEGVRVTLIAQPQRAAKSSLTNPNPNQNPSRKPLPVPDPSPGPIRPSQLSFGPYSATGMGLLLCNEGASSSSRIARPAHLSPMSPIDGIEEDSSESNMGSENGRESGGGEGGSGATDGRVRIPKGDRNGRRRRRAEGQQHRSSHVQVAVWLSIALCVLLVSVAAVGFLFSWRTSIINGELEEKLKRTSAWDIPPQPVHQVDRGAASVALRLLPAYSNADPDYDAVQRTRPFVATSASSAASIFLPNTRQSSDSASVALSTATTASYPPSPRVSHSQAAGTSVRVSQQHLLDAAASHAFHWSAWSNCSAVCTGAVQMAASQTVGRARGFQQRFALCDDVRLDLSKCLPAELEPVQVRHCTLDCNATCTARCYNGGRCIRHNTCACPPGWTGRRCERPVCSPHCLNGGACYRPGVCVCPEGYAPPRCTAPCRQRCLNGGVCNGLGACDCANGFYGPQCEFSQSKSQSDYQSSEKKHSASPGDYREYIEYESNAQQSQYSRR